MAVAYRSNYLACQVRKEATLVRRLELTNTEHSLNELLPDRRHELTYSLRPRRHMISRLVVDHIAYLTAISLLGYSLKTAIDTTCNLILVKLRPDSFFNKIILYCIVLYIATFVYRIAAVYAMSGVAYTAAVYPITSYCLLQTTTTMLIATLI